MAVMAVMAVMAAMTPEVVASGEGPVWRPEPGDLIVTSVSEGWLFQVDVQTGAAHRFADTAGDPNGALLLDDGGILVAQNGGLEVGRWSRHTPPPVRP
jgi:sugar lactone lactonase YvrE